MAKKRKPTLADYVEAAERRVAPKAQAQARASSSGTWGSIWLGVVVFAVVLTAGALFFLRYKKLI